MASPDILPGSDIFLTRRQFIQAFGGEVLRRTLHIPDPPLINKENLLKPKTDLITRVVDKQHPISQDEINTRVIPELVNLTEALNKLGLKNPLVYYDGTLGNQYLVEDLARLINDSRKQGDLRLIISNVFRDIPQQMSAWNQAKDKSTVEAVFKDTRGRLYSTSTHAPGLTCDFTCLSINCRVDINSGFENTQEGRWLLENGPKYGFVQSLKKDRHGRVHDDLHEETWHQLYIGQELAADYLDQLKSNKVNSVYDYLGRYN
jgi:LAS superfamily LD-carboxypeptidase LdcB